MLSGPSAPTVLAWRRRGGGPSRSSAASDIRVSSFCSRSGTRSIEISSAKATPQYPNKRRSARAGAPGGDHDVRDRFRAIATTSPASSRGRRRTPPSMTPWPTCRRTSAVGRPLVCPTRRGNSSSTSGSPSTTCSISAGTQIPRAHWPTDYWPKTAAPASAKAWEASLRLYREDRAALQALARDPAIDLTAADSRTARDRPICGRSCWRSITRPIIWASSSWRADCWVRGKQDDVARSDSPIAP